MVVYQRVRGRGKGGRRCRIHDVMQKRCTKLPCSRFFFENQAGNKRYLTLCRVPCKKQSDEVGCLEHDTKQEQTKLETLGFTMRTPNPTQTQNGTICVGGRNAGTNPSNCKKSKTRLEAILHCAWSSLSRHAAITHNCLREGGWGCVNTYACTCLHPMWHTPCHMECAP